MTADTVVMPANHPPTNGGKVGVLIVNLGTPDGTDYTSMRRYLRVGLEKGSTISISCEASCEHADVGDCDPRFC